MDSDIRAVIRALKTNPDAVKILKEELASIPIVLKSQNRPSVQHKILVRETENGIEIHEVGGKKVVDITVQTMTNDNNQPTKNFWICFQAVDGSKYGDRDLADVILEPPCPSCGKTPCDGEGCGGSE